MDDSNPLFPSLGAAEDVLMLQGYPTGPTAIGGAAGVSCISSPSCISEASCASLASDVPAVHDATRVR
jgi:hypothetical protein